MLRHYSITLFPLRTFATRLPLFEQAFSPLFLKVELEPILPFPLLLVELLRPSLTYEILDVSIPEKE